MDSSEPIFHNFPLLPAELRLQIWSLAIPNRTITIYCTKGISRPTKRRYVEFFSTHTPPPPLLYANRESRSVALLHYISYFATPSRPYGIWASFPHDVVSFPEGTISYLGPKELAGIERMELQVKDFAYFGYFNLSTLRLMKNLKELKLTVEKGVRYTWGAGEAGVEITRDLEAEVKEWPEWRVPEIRILQRETGREIVVIRGREDLVEEEEGGDGSVGLVQGGFGYQITH